MSLSNKGKKMTRVSGKSVIIKMITEKLEQLGFEKEIDPKGFIWLWSLSYSNIIISTILHLIKLSEEGKLRRYIPNPFSFVIYLHDTIFRVYYKNRFGKEMFKEDHEFLATMMLSNMNKIAEVIHKKRYEIRMKYVTN